VAGVVVKHEGIITLLANFGVLVALSAVVNSTGLSLGEGVFRVLDSIIRRDFPSALAVDFDERFLTSVAAEVVFAFEASFVAFVAVFVSGEELVAAVFNAGVDFEELTSVTVSTAVEVVFLASGAGTVGAFDAGLAGGDISDGAFGGAGGAVD
jgi:hypothetical protein